MFGRTRWCSLLPCEDKTNKHRCNSLLTAVLRYLWTPHPRRSLLRCALLLREDPEDELSLLVGFKGGGDDDVLSGRQTETLCHFPQVNVRLTFSLGGCIEEEVLLQMLILPFHLWVEVWRWLLERFLFQSKIKQFAVVPLWSGKSLFLLCAQTADRHLHLMYIVC